MSAGPAITDIWTSQVVDVVDENTLPKRGIFASMLLSFFVK